MVTKSQEYVQLRSHLPTLEIAHKKIIVRADLNVPLDNGIILNDFKLKALLPTLQFLFAQNAAQVIIITHLGRPTGKDQALSTQVLIPWFEAHGYTAVHGPTLEDIAHLTNRLVIAENIRFFPAEKSSSITFAYQLRALADLYILEAFGALHRTDTSLALAPYLFDPHQRTIGFLVEHELKQLAPLVINPAHPYVVCLGGGKGTDKLSLLHALIGMADTFLLSPAISLLFSATQKNYAGILPADADLIKKAADCFSYAQQLNKPILLPHDYIVSSTTHDSLSIRNTTELVPTDIPVSIGPQTSGTYAALLKEAKTIFFNGLPGFLNRPETLTGANALFSAMRESNAYCVIGGGDSTAAAFLFDPQPSFAKLSTGGGATLALLSNQLLPGLEPYCSCKRIK